MRRSKLHILRIGNDSAPSAVQMATPPFRLACSVHLPGMGGMAPRKGGVVARSFPNPIDEAGYSMSYGRECAATRVDAPPRSPFISIL
jgi:hypothetical protein